MNIALPPLIGKQSLTEREQQVLREIAAGRNSADVAERLTVSKRTIDFHLINIYRKLGAHNRTQAVNAARARGVWLES